MDGTAIGIAVQKFRQVMAEKIIVDVQNWPRREHYHYFGELDDPYFGITAKADFTSCYRQAWISRILNTPAGCRKDSRFRGFPQENWFRTGTGC